VEKRHIWFNFFL